MIGSATVLILTVMLAGCGQSTQQPPEPPAAPTLPPTGSAGEAKNTPGAGSEAHAPGELDKDRTQTLVEGHSATVDCLHGERAQTDGNELRCEDWSYVRQNYLQAR